MRHRMADLALALISIALAVGIVVVALVQSA